MEDVLPDSHNEFLCDVSSPIRPPPPSSFDDFSEGEGAGGEADDVFPTQPLQDVCNELGAVNLGTPIKRAPATPRRMTKSNNDDETENEMSVSWQIPLEPPSGDRKKKYHDPNMSVDSVISMDFMSDGDEGSFDDVGESSVALNMSRPFDMNLLKSSIEIGSDALHRVVDRDVILVVGKTGTGKSTLLQGLAGKTMFATDHTTEYKGQVVQKTVFEAKDALPDFEIGHAKKSQTKAIRCFERTISEGKTVLYLDSPGLEDTEGPEMDIATSAMLNQVARTAKSLRFCILIHSASLVEDRGGQIRSILKFTRNFVKDFQQEKQSFVFLFTHTHEIRSVDSVASARNYLLEEVIRILKETKDEDVKAVLDYMRVCLKKGYPLVDVMHPLETDFRKMRKTLETKVKKVKNPTIALNSGLTTASKILLEGKVKSLTLQLRDQLNRGTSDTKQIVEIRDTFMYLEKYIETVDIQDAAKSCRETIDRFCSEQQQIFDQELQRGKDLEQVFVSSNVQAMSNAMRILVDLKENATEHHFATRLRCEVQDHYQRVSEGSEPCEDILNASIRLNKLMAWKSVLPEFEALYTRFQGRYGDLIQKFADALEAMDTLQLENASEEEIYNMVEYLQFLESVSVHHDTLSHHGLDTRLAVDIFHSKKEDLKSLILSLQPEASPVAETHSTDADALTILLFKARKLDALRVSLDDAGVCKDLAEISRGVLRDLEGHVVGICSEATEGLLPQMVPYDDHSLKILRNIRNVCEICEGISGDQWKEIRVGYSKILGTIRSLLFAFAKDLDSRSSLVPLGVENGREDGKALKAFDACIPFDEFFNEEERFVEYYSVDYHRVYDEKIEKLRDDVAQSFVELRTCERDPVSNIRNLRCSLLECHQISELASATGNKKWDSLGPFVRSELIQYTDHLYAVEESVWPEWAESVNKGDCTRDNIKTVTEKVNKLLDAIDTFIRNVPHPVDSRASTLRNGITDKIQSLSSELKTHLFDEKDYEAIAKYLGLVEVVGSFAQVGKCFPSLDELKLSVSSMVLEDAKAIEELIYDTSQWDEIDDLIQKFEKAKAVDPYLGLQATSSLDSVKRLREQKESEVDNLLGDLVSTQDFKGIREFLVPLAESRDQIKKQKFNQHQAAICSSLTDIHEVAEKLFNSPTSEENIRVIAQTVKKLQDAEQEIGCYLRTSLNLSGIINTLRERIDCMVEGIIENASVACERGDFVSMQTLSNCVDACSKFLSTHLNEKTKINIQGVLNSSKTRLDSISSLSEKFLSSNFEDRSELIFALSSLKKCHESSDSTLTADHFTCVYMETVKQLGAMIDDHLRELDSLMCDTKCYGIGIPVLHALAISFRSGLQDHVDEDSLPFKCQEKLISWREGEKEHDREMDICSEDAEEKLTEWCKKLEKLESPSAMGRIQRWISGTGSTYDYERQKLENKIRSVFARGKGALQNRDYVEVQNCICILDLSAKMVGKHIISSEGNARSLRGQSMFAFLELTEQLEKLLRHDNFNRFKALFGEYRDLILSIPTLHLQPATKKAFEVINQVAYEMLANEITAVLSLTSIDGICFDFPALKSHLEKARNIGGFIADYFPLLREELKGSDLVKGGKWLEEIMAACHEYFSDCRDFSLLKHYAVLGVPMSASKKDIGQAYRKCARDVHPDKKKHAARNTDDSDVNADFRDLKDSRDKLTEYLDSHDHGKQPFDDNLRSLGHVVRLKVGELLTEQRYESVKMALFSISDLSELSDLVDPSLDTTKIAQETSNMVKNHVLKIRTEVDTNWSERRYRLLNDSMSDLKAMEMHFSSYPHVFPTSWNTGISELIERRIQELGACAKGLLSTKNSAKENEEAFRTCFIEMGSVLVELSLLKEFTKRVMCDVLETCLRFDWGYSYLFEFGLSLQRGNGDQTEEEMRVAHMVLAEFSHFKEVMTMAWNTETTQKPVEDTVRGIKGQDIASQRVMQVDYKTLLEHYYRFEAEYNSLLGEYIRPGAELRNLVEKTQSVCQRAQPGRCDDGWTKTMKGELPLILAGVFAVFTVVKSGESFNRIEDSEEANKLGDTILMKPHNIQILTILEMFGCGDPDAVSLDSQLLQIRTGEGKSMILGAAATVLAMLGYRVRCVCYSDYLSTRDYRLFKDVFYLFGLTEDDVKYGKITRLSEDTTAAKGDIRNLTEQLIRIGEPGESSRFIAGRLGSSENPPTSRLGNALLPSSSISQYSIRDHREPATVSQAQDRSISSHGQAIRAINNYRSSKSCREEILLVDEVDVFFGSDFYGQTYNQVAQLREPEVVEILKSIWNTYKKGRHRQRLHRVKASTAYKRLIKKVPGFEYVVDNEISLMLDQVHRVDTVPYVINENDKIGYKVMDTVSYTVTLGYCTAFAYLKEADLGRLKDNDRTLERELCMNISCGQFSYANISPTRILGVSGTLEAMGPFERKVLGTYGIDKFLFMPSVYGQSNFSFQKTGDGIHIENGISDFYQRLSTEINRIKKLKRAVIVFFRDSASLKAFEDSAHYRKLGRQKAKLTEDMETTDKDFVIKRAATSSQLTICSAVFGRGTDFFCKDQRVTDAGGVHVIQTFLSSEKSEEIQIQGRTARQGKDGTYQMILLDSDLQDEFGLEQDFTCKTPKNEWYQKLCVVREKRYRDYCSKVAANLAEATARDKNTHRYFDSLLANDKAVARSRFKDIYLKMKKRQAPSNIDIDLALIIDVTGSMSPHMGALRKTIQMMLQGESAILSKLKGKFRDTIFALRVGIMAYRDLDDKQRQFYETTSSRDGHFTGNMADVLRFTDKITRNPSGGFDLAEDHFGAIHRCLTWHSKADWKSSVKMAMVFTDSPAHGFTPTNASQVANADSYPVRHPLGITAEKVVENLISRDVDLLFCSFNPVATGPTEQCLAEFYLRHPQNSEEKEITVIPMVPSQSAETTISNLVGNHGQHIIFVLDESGSMKSSWGGVVDAYRKYIDRRLQSQTESDLVSVVQFGSRARVTVSMEPLRTATAYLRYRKSGTCYAPAATSVREVAIGGPRSHVPVVVFMSDGITAESDAQEAAQTFEGLNDEVKRFTGQDLELHVIAFGAGLEKRQLQEIANSSAKGKLYTGADTAQLSNIFVDIANCSYDLGAVLESEIGKRISDAVSDKVSMEYLG